MGRPAYRLYRLAWAGLDWVYPPHCGGCDRLSERWCKECQQSTQQLVAPFCRVCGLPGEYPQTCPECRESPPPFQALRSWAGYNGALRNAIHRLKYGGDIALAESLARPMIALFETLKWPVDQVVPVAASAARRAERGYNQAALLALPLALACGLRYAPDALVKRRETRSQVGLRGEERRSNVQGAFAARPARALGQRVLVVDDVATSGATLRECAQALLDAGARQVYALTLARAGSSFWLDPPLAAGPVYS